MEPIMFVTVARVSATSDQYVLALNRLEITTSAPTSKPA